MKQLAIFLENKKGSLADVTNILTTNGIDIHAMSIADTQDFGILRLIVKDSQKAYETLKNNGKIVTLTNVTVALIKHEVGSLSKILEILDSNDVNIEYMYAFTTSNGEEAYAVFRFEDGKKGVDVLTESGIVLYTEEDLK